MADRKDAGSVRSAATTPPRGDGMTTVRGFREIAGPTRRNGSWEGKALECLYSLALLAEDDPTREDYRCAAQVYASLEVADALRSLPKGVWEEQGHYKQRTRY